MNHSHHQVKVVGVNGQISIGKEFAGKMVIIDQIEEGTWIIKSGEFIPDSEKWLYRENNIYKLQKALDWADKNPPVDNFDELVDEIDDESNKNRHEQS